MKILKFILNARDLILKAIMLILATIITIIICIAIFTALYIILDDWSLIQNFGLKQYLGL